MDVADRRRCRACTAAGSWGGTTHRPGTARGRWRADQPDTVEIYAERLEHARTREIVVPYLEATYSQEAGALCDWIEEHGGIRLPFAELAGDPRTTARGGYLRGSALFRMEGALEELARSP